MTEHNQHRKHCSHILITDILQQPGLCLSFGTTILQYVCDLQQLSLQLLLLSDKLFLSFQTLVRSDDTGTSLQSLAGAGTNLQAIQSLRSGSAI